MSVSPFPTLCAHTGGTENKADFFGFGQQNIGTQDYLLIAHCPILTSFYGAGGTSQFASNVKLGGLVYQQSSSLSDVALWPGRFEDVVASRSMVSVYGSDMQTFAQRGFVWASQIDFKIVSAQATRVGAVYIGAILISQLQGATQSTGPTFRDLIEIASAQTASSEGSFSLSAAMVNNNLVNAQEPTGTNIIDPAYSGEIISYAIIQKGAQALTGASNL